MPPHPERDRHDLIHFGLGRFSRSGADPTRQLSVLSSTEPGGADGTLETWPAVNEIDQVPVNVPPTVGVVSKILENVKKLWVEFLMLALLVLGGIKLLLDKAIDVKELYDKLWKPTTG